jgi:lipopolysaccharide export system protein LptC
MARDEVDAEPASAGFDDDEVDLSFAGPEPVASAPWPMRLVDLASAYLPLLMMAALAGGTWWLVQNAPSTDTPRAAVAPRHEADYVMTRFVVQRFGSDGALRTELEGDRLRHFPDDDTLEIDHAKIRAIGSDGVVTLAVADRALANGDGSEVQLLGNARVTRPAADKLEAIEFHSEFLQGFRNIERLRTHLPVVVTQGQSVIHAEGMEYDNLARIVDLKGRNGGTFVAPNRTAGG